MNPIEQAREYFKLQEEREWSSAEIAAYKGVVKQTVENHLDLLRLPLKLQELVADRALTQTDARKILRLGVEESEMIRLAHLKAAESQQSRAAPGKRKKRQPEPLPVLSPAELQYAMYEEILRRAFCAPDHRVFPLTPEKFRELLKDFPEKEIRQAFRAIKSFWGRAAVPAIHPGRNFALAVSHLRNDSGMRLAEAFRARAIPEPLKHLWPPAP